MNDGRDQFAELQDCSKNLHVMPAKHIWSIGICFAETALPVRQE
jgi:hypothetical protein